MTLRITDTQDLAICLALRATVFVHEQGVPLELERDELDDQAIHVLAFDDEEPIGTARVVLKGETGKIGRVCVVASHRGQGVGEALIRACLDILRGQPGVTRAMLGSQTHAIPFYEKLGFTAYGPEYLDAGLPHRDMAVEL